jgi:hypothetical protein
MKPSETDEICDKCKDRLAKYHCMGCEAMLCTGCSYLFRIQIGTLDFESPEEKKINPTQSAKNIGYNTLANAARYATPYETFYSQKKMIPTSIGVIDWAICEDCKKGLNKKNAITEIQESEEFKKFVNKLRKVTLASTILTGLDESEVSTDIDVKANFPNGLWAGYSSKKRTLFGKLIGKKP